MREILRKSIHFVGLAYIPAYDLLGKEGMIVAVGILTAIAILVEFLRQRYDYIPEFLLRDYEKESVGAYVYFGIAAFVITAFLPKKACFVGIVTGSLGDGVAGILKHHFRLGKNVSSLGMLLSSSAMLGAIGLLSPKSLTAVLAGTLAERIDRVNDNLSVPIVSAFIYRALEIVL